MKKVAKAVLVVFVATMFLTSCSKDDDNNSQTSGNIVGDWEFLKDGTIVNGQEILVPYDHTSGCDRDFVKILANGISEDHMFEDNLSGGCSESIDEATWTKNGTTFTLNYGGGDLVVTQILILNSATLKVKFTDQENGETGIVEFARK